MPTVLQFRRGTTSQNNSFTGSAGEISVDTDTNQLRIHDGSTAGGATVGIDTKNIQIGVTGDNELDTSSGNLTIDSAGGTVTIDDNLTVSGNLTVNGTTTTVSSTNTTITDNLIELNSGAASNANDTGILIERGSTGDNAIIAWDESADKFTVGTTTATANSTGDISITTGTLVANIEGDVTGNADTATALETARTIAGQSFDGTGNITIASTDLSDTSSIALLTSTQTLTNKTLTSPKIGTSILDTNGNELFNVTATASAVNEITYANAATGNGPTLTASGDDTNIDINITPKGSGQVVIDGLKYPSADGDADQILKTDGSGNLSFADAGGGGTSWQAVKTTGFTAVAGEGYFINTTSGAFTMTLPASPTQGNEVSIIDYAGTFDTNNLTVGRNGNSIQGAAADLTVSVERAGFTLVFVDATQGWLLKDK